MNNREKQLEIGKKIYEKELTVAEASAVYDVGYYTARVYLREYKAENDIHTCCICHKEYRGHGNNAEPYKKGRCCNRCNIRYVIPCRIMMTPLK